MPPRQRRATGLTDEDVARLRTQLSAGGRPRVRLSGPQFEAGSTGAVVRIGDPAVDGSDYLTVRVKVNGVTDELAFAPAELSLPAAGRTGGPAKAAAAPRKTAAAGAKPIAAPAKPVAAQAKPVAAQANPVDARARPAAPSKPAAAAGPPVGEPSAAGRRRKAPAPPPKVSVTLSSSGASWSVSASRGAKGIVKNVAVPPGVVTAIAELIEQAVLTEAVAEINETALAEAQVRAEQLRAELSRLEAVLATHRSPR